VTSKADTRRQGHKVNPQYNQAADLLLAGNAHRIAVFDGPNHLSEMEMWCAHNGAIVIVQCIREGGVEIFYASAHGNMVDLLEELRRFLLT
jgi:hypothetical protein